MDLWLLQGIDVAVNGSRAHLPQAQQRYGAQLLPVCLQVSAAILRRRLQDRGRESAEQIEQRLARAAEYQQSLPAGCRVLHNDGPLDDTRRRCWRCCLPPPDKLRTRRHERLCPAENRRQRDP